MVTRCCVETFYFRKFTWFKISSSIEFLKIRHKRRSWEHLKVTQTDPPTFYIIASASIFYHISWNQKIEISHTRISSKDYQKSIFYLTSKSFEFFYNQFELTLFSVWTTVGWFDSKDLRVVPVEVQLKIEKFLTYPIGCKCPFFDFAKLIMLIDISE